MEKSPSFFKILIFDYVRRLRIPPAFTKNFEKDLLEKLPQESILETCDGRFWHVDIEKIDDKLCFKYGWRQFVKHNSLKMGDLIVFTYQGNFRFKLEIYGRDCCKKRVEMFNKRVQRPRTCKAVPRRNRQGPVGSEGSTMLNECSIGKACKVETVVISDTDDDDDDVDGESENLKEPSVIQTADNFTSIYPFVKVAMTHSYVHCSYVCLPKRFMRANDLRLTGNDIKLKFSNKIWLAMMYNHPRYARLSAGWNEFVKDNGLREDHDCIFELIDKDDVTFRVSIFPKIT